jgi:hypothetical protein
VHVPFYIRASKHNSAAAATSRTMFGIFAAVIIAAFAVSPSAAHNVLSLTPSNYDELTEGKTVFIKFFAPLVGSVAAVIGNVIAAI